MPVVRNPHAISAQRRISPTQSSLRQRVSNAVMAKANGTEYGLAASVWSGNISRAHNFARKLRAGTVWVNSYRAVCPSVPFGGFGASGLGRENGMESILDFMETKAVWVELSGATRDPFRMA